MEDLNDVDPIYGQTITEAYTLGKTRYSLFSLYEWFLVRKCFINPMTNNLLTNEEQNMIVNKFVEFNLLPKDNYSKMGSHRIVVLMEKYKLLLENQKINNEKIEALKKRLIFMEDKFRKARKKERYEIIIERINKKIEKLEKNVFSLKES